MVPPVALPTVTCHVVEATAEESRAKPLNNAKEGNIMLFAKEERREEF